MDTDESSRLHTPPDSPSRSSEEHSDVPKINVETVEDNTPDQPENKNDCQAAETSKTTNSKNGKNKTGESSSDAGQNLLTPSEESRLKRTSSLKLEKESCDTSSKKIVRFADALGLDLVDVRVFVDEDVSKVPTSAFADLKLKSNNSQDFWSTSDKCCRHPSARGVQEYCFVPQFAQPGADAYFLDKVKRQKVCLENVMIRDLKVIGLVRILNMGFEKVVLARYTTNDWATQSEELATYVPNSSDGVTDKFGFTIQCRQARLETKLIFVLKYEVNNEEFWDNNNSQNYVLVCESRNNSQNSKS